MSMNSEDLKRKIAADAIKKEEEEKKLAALKQANIDEQQKKMKTELANSKKTFEQESEVKFAPLRAAYEKDWKPIVDDYTKQFKREPDKDGALVFSTREDAVSFFAAQAKSMRKFCVIESVDGKLIDFHLLSCGDGNLYKGTAAEVRAQLEQAISANPKNKDAIDGLELFKSLVPIAPTPAVEMRSALKDGRAADNGKTAADQTDSTPAPRPTGSKG